MKFKRVNHFTLRDTIYQLIEAFVMYYVVFAVVYFINKFYTLLVPNLTIRVFWTWQLLVYPPILFFIASRLWYLQHRERHSFAMIITAFAFSEYAIYHFGGLILYLKSFQYLGMPALTIGTVLLTLLYLAVNFFLASVFGASVHSLFTDRIRGFKKDDNRKS